MEIQETLKEIDLRTKIGEEGVAAQVGAGNATFLIKKDALLSFVEHLYIQTTADLISLENDEKEKWSTSSVSSDIFMRMSSLAVLRTANNNLMETSFPPILPLQCSELRSRGFYDIVRMHEERLLQTIASELIMSLEDEFCNFKRYVSTSPTSKEHLAKFQIMHRLVATFLRWHGPLSNNVFKFGFIC